MDKLKKLLSVLAAFGLTATAATSVVACTVDGDIQSIKAGKNGTVKASIKLVIKKGTKVDDKTDNDYFIVQNPDFAVIKTDKTISHGTKLDALDQIQITSFKFSKKYTTGTQSTHNGTIMKDIRVIAELVFKVDVKEKQYSEKVAVASTIGKATVDKTFQRLNVEVPGSGAEPMFNTATYDGKTTINVAAKDLDKIEGGFDSNKLAYSPELSVDKVENTATSLTITLKEPLKQYKTNKTYSIEYKTDKLDLKTSFITNAVSLDETATLDKDGKLITIKGTNLGTNDDVKSSITSTGAPALDISSASTTDNLLTINLNTAIVKDYEDHDWTITYKLNSGDELTSKLALAKKGQPIFSTAKYDRTKKAITITGTDFDNFPDGKVDANKFTIDGSKSKVSEASINGDSITAELDSPIEEYSSPKSYSISYKDEAADNLTIKGVSFNVDATALNGSAQYSGGTTITITGKNLDNLGDVTKSVSIDNGAASIKSASVTNDTLTIELNSAIDWTYSVQNFNITYKLNSGNELKSSFSVAAKTMPVFTKATYSRDSKSITIEGSNFTNFKDFDAKNLSIDAKSGAKITDAKVAGNKITATLDKEINETKSQGSYEIKYSDSKWNLNLSTTVTVDATSLSTKASYDKSTKTITISGTNLGKHDDVKSSVDVQVENGSKLDITSAKTTDSELTIALSKDIDPSYSNQTIDITYTLNSGDKLDPAKFDVAATKAPTFGTTTYDGDKTITINTTDINNMIGGFVQSNLKITNATAKENIAFASATVDGESIIVNLNDRLKAYAADQNYSISYGDGKLPVALASSFMTKGLSITDTKYDDTTGTITITGKNFGIDRDVKSQITIDGQVDGKDLVIASANITGGNLVIKLDKPIGQIAEDKTFNITWTLTGGDKLDGSFSIKGSNFTGDAKYDEKVDIKIDGSNLGNNEVPDSKISVTGAAGKDQIKVKSAETKESKAKKFFSIFSGDSSDSYMDITLDSAIAKSYDPTRSFNIAYTLSSGEIINSSFTMNGVDKPSFGQFEYDQDNKTITIHGDKLSQDYFLGYNQKNWTVEGQQVASVNFIDSKNLQIVLTEPIKKFTTDKTYAVTYKDSSNGLDVNGTLTVNKTTLETTASYNENGTIAVSGTNLGNNADVSKVISGLDSSIKVTKASTTDNTLTLEVSPIAKKFKAQDFSFNYGLSGGETISGIKFTVNGDKALAPTLNTATYDADKKEVTVTGTNFDQISWNGTFSIVDSAITAAKKSVNGNSIVLTLSDAIAEQDIKKTYQVKYTDSDLPDGITTTTGFVVKAKSVFKSAALQSDNETIKVMGENFLTSDTTAATVTGCNVASTTVVSETEIDVVLDKPIEAVYWDVTKFSISLSNDGVSYKQDLSVDKNGKQPTFGDATYDDNTTITIKGTNFTQISDWMKGNFTGLPDGVNVTAAKTNSDTELVLTINKQIPLLADAQHIEITYTDEHKLSWSTTNTIDIVAKATLNTKAELKDSTTITASGTNLINGDASVTVAGETVDSATITGNNLLTIKVKEPIVSEYWWDADKTFAISYDAKRSGTLTSTLSVAKDPAVPAFTKAEISQNNTVITITGTNISKLGKLDNSEFSVTDQTLDIKSVDSTDTTITIVLNNALSAGSLTIKYDDGHGTNISTSLNVTASYELKSAYYDENKTIKVEIANLENVSDKSIFNSNWSIIAPDKKDYKVVSATIEDSFVKLTLDKKIDALTIADANNNGSTTLLNSKITVNFTDPSNNKVNSVIDNLPEKDWKSFLTKDSVCKYELYDGSKARIILKGTNLASVDWSVKDNWKFNGDMGGSPSDPMNANNYENSSDIIGIKVIDANTVELDMKDYSGSFSTTLQTFGIMYTAPDGTKYRTVYQNIMYQDPANGLVA